MNSTEEPRADTSSDASGLASLTAIYLQQTTNLSNALLDMWSAWAQAADVVSRERGLAVGKSLSRLFAPEAWKAGELGPLLEELRQTLSLPQLADVPNLNLSAIDTFAATIDLIGLLQQYISISLPLWLSATRQFQAEIAARAKQGNGVKSPGEALDLWNGIVDRALMEFNRSGEFAKIQRRLLRASAQYRLELRKLGDRGALLLDMPTRAEMTDVYRRMHDMQREVQKLRRELSALRRRKSTSADPTQPEACAGES
jgi:Poly(R)-hydroxyalkanoic acid synthase subunit (PHA_synth_III_E)